jgi:hypothetical protein
MSGLLALPPKIFQPFFLVVFYLPLFRGSRCLAFFQYGVPSPFRLSCPVQDYTFFLGVALFVFFEFCRVIFCAALAALGLLTVCITYLHALQVC